MKNPNSKNRPHRCHYAAHHVFIKALVTGILLIVFSGARTHGAFVHPGIYYNAKDLEFMRKKLVTKAEPWYSVWEKNKPNARDDGWTPHPMAEWDVSQKIQGVGYMQGDPVVAHKEALQWALTGNPANAAKAIEILNAWSSTLKTIVPLKPVVSEKLSTGINIHHFANAAELLCYAKPGGKSSGWAEADIQRFKKMLGLFYEATKDFQSGYNGNWDALIMNSMICSAVFLDDQAMFDRVAKHYVQGQKPNGGLTNYIYPSGQCQESGRDQGHVQWGLCGFASLCEVAWKQGVDLYGAENNRLMVGFEYTAKYMLGEDVLFEWRGGPWDAKTISEQQRGLYISIWEAAYQHYVYRKGLEMPYTKRIIYGTSVKINGAGAAPRPYRPEGAMTVGISWGTFTMFKGEEDPQAVKKTTPNGGGVPVQGKISK